VEPEGILSTALAVLDTPPPARRPALWDGRAGERIAEVLLNGGPAGSRPRPTDLVAGDPPDQPRQSPLG
jgi:UDP-N-acetylglucosamine 2-epimerase (non-hydrolysing)